MTFYDRLMDLMAEKRVRQVDLTRDLGFTSANFAIWRKGGKPKMETIKVIADYFGVSQSYLLGLTADKHVENQTSYVPEGYEEERARLIPVFSGIPNSEDIFQEYKYIDENIYCSQKLKPIDKLLSITAVQDTMSPIIEAADYIIAKYTELCRSGDMVIYRLFGDTSVRWLKETENEIQLIPENLFDQEKNPKGYKPIILPKDRIDDYDFQIIGKVYEVRKVLRNLERKYN